jgi:ubiquitin related modifier 1
MKLNLIFSGGSEVLFDNKREHEVDVSSGITIKRLLSWILDNLIKDKDRSDLLITDGDVRPGILVLVNDTDYEITGGVSYSKLLVLQTFV